MRGGQRESDWYLYSVLARSYRYAFAFFFFCFVFSDNNLCLWIEIEFMGKIHAVRPNQIDLRGIDKPCPSRSGVGCAFRE